MSPLEYAISIANLFSCKYISPAIGTIIILAQMFPLTKHYFNIVIADGIRVQELNGTDLHTLDKHSYSSNCTSPYSTFSSNKYRMQIIDLAEFLMQY